MRSPRTRRRRQAHCSRVSTYQESRPVTAQGRLTPALFFGAANTEVGRHQERKEERECEQNQKICRHSRESGNPFSLLSIDRRSTWIPAFAGMTPSAQ